MPPLDILFCEAGVHDAVEAPDVVFEVFEDAADDAVAAAMDLEADLGFVAGVA